MRIVIDEYVEFEFYIHLTTWYINTRNWFTPYEIANDVGLGVEKKLFCFTWQTHKLIEKKFDVFQHTLLQQADYILEEPRRKFKTNKQAVLENSMALN